MRTSDEEIISKILSINQKNKVLKIYRELRSNKTRIYVDYICGECNSVLIRINWDGIKKKKTKYCRKCKTREKKYNINFIEKELLKLGFEWLNKEDYKDANSLLETRCLNCGKIAKANVHSRIIEKRQCLRCIGMDVKTIEEFKQEVFDLVGNDYTVLSNEYTATHDTNIIIKHNSCGNEYLASRSNFRKGRRCPFCNMSKGEERIKRILDNNNINHMSQKTFDGLLGVGHGLLSYDFYLPQYNLLIEYQGEQHENYIEGLHESLEDFERQQEHDRRKREYAKEHNIDLLEIWYWDFNNIENILKELLFNE